MRTVLAITLERGEEGPAIPRQAVLDDLIQNIEHESVWIDDTEYQVSDVTEVFELTKRERHMLRRLLKAEAAATRSVKVRAYIERMRAKLDDPMPEIEVTDA